MKSLVPFLEESPGVWSSIRLQMLLSFFFCGLLPALTWIFFCFCSGKIIEFPSSAATFLLGVISVASAAKVVQYRTESAPNVSPSAGIKDNLI
jgi:hypothetical protein